MTRERHGAASPPKDAAPGCWGKTSCADAGRCDTRPGSRWRISAELGEPLLRTAVHGGESPAHRDGAQTRAAGQREYALDAVRVGGPVEQVPVVGGERGQLDPVVRAV